MEERWFRYIAVVIVTVSYKEVAGAQKTSASSCQSASNTECILSKRVCWFVYAVCMYSLEKTL